MSLQSVGDFMENHRSGYLGRVFVASRVEKTIKELLGFPVRVIFKAGQFTLVCPSAAVATAANMRRGVILKEIGRHYRNKNWRLIIKVKNG